MGEVGCQDGCRREDYMDSGEQELTAVVIDVETSGLAAARDRVIEIGAVRIEAGRIVAEYDTLIEVDTPIHWAAERVHGISREMLRGQPEPKTVWPEVAEFVGVSLIVGHNVQFDLRFVRQELYRCGLELRNRSKCTVHLSRRLLPHLPNHKLETVARHLLGELPADCRMHRALDDARLTARVWLELMGNSS